jgi:hypothetical protein
VDPEVALKKVLGVHVYVVPPDTVSTVDVPEQMVGLLTEIVGVALMVIVDDFVEEHPVVVPVTV